MGGRVTNCGLRFLPNTNITASAPQTGQGQSSKDGVGRSRPERAGRHGLVIRMAPGAPFTARPQPAVFVGIRTSRARSAARPRRARSPGPAATRGAVTACAPRLCCAPGSAVLSTPRRRLRGARGISCIHMIGFAGRPLGCTCSVSGGCPSTCWPVLASRSEPREGPLGDQDEAAHSAWPTGFGDDACMLGRGSR